MPLNLATATVTECTPGARHYAPSTPAERRRRSPVRTPRQRTLSLQDGLGFAFWAIAAHCPSGVSATVSIFHPRCFTTAGFAARGAWIQWPRAMPSGPASSQRAVQAAWSCSMSLMACSGPWIWKCSVASPLPLLFLKSSIHFRQAWTRPGMMRSTSSTESASLRGPISSTLTARIFQSAWPSSMRQTAPSGLHRTTSPTPTTLSPRSRTSRGSSSPGALKNLSVWLGSR
mmetsp:Transcript_33027/g.98149  ORF Transcript_33027/g.98149 Transcript_33027/m.98149 type:complete len:230 (-) Transcript_33027:32-721(-)